MLRHVRKYVFGFAGILPFLITLFWLEQKQNKDSPNRLNRAYKEAQQIIIDKELDCIRLIQNPFSDTASLLRNRHELIQLSAKHNLSVNIIKNDTLLFWTDNLINASLFYTSIPEGVSFVDLSNGYYLVFKQQRGTYFYLLFYQIKSEYQFKNQYIQDAFSRELSFIKDGLLADKPSEKLVSIKSLAGKHLFSLQILAYSTTTPAWLVSIICLLLGVQLVLAHIIFRFYIRTHFWLTTFLFAAFFGFLRWLSITYHAPDFLYRLKLFDPGIYASSVWFPSLGDLFIDSVLVLWYFVLLETRSSGLKKRKYKGSKWLLINTGYCILMFTTGHLIITSIQSITIDSQISFTISNFFSISFFTYIGLLVAIIQLLILYFVCRNYARIARLGRFAENKHSYFVFGTAILCYVAIADAFGHHTNFFIIAVISIILVYVGFKSVRTTFNRFQQYFIVVMIISVCSSVCINHWLSIKEQENRKLFAVKLISQNDITTDYYLRSVEKKMVNDRYFLNYFLNPLIIKSDFEKRIRQLYFTGYLSKFDVNVYDFDSSGYHFRQRNSYTYDYLNKLYNTKTSESINKYFRYVISSVEAKGYLAKFEMKYQGHVVGYLFISLQPKLIQDENRFDDLLIEGYRQRKKEHNYSYAVYKDKGLIFQSGDYPYRITNTWGETNNEFKFFAEAGYDHMLYTDKQPLTIIVSRVSDSYPQMIGLFSFIFTFCTVALIVLLFIYVGINAQFFQQFVLFRNKVVHRIQYIFNSLLMVDKPDILYIRTRIQTSIIFILFITLIFSGYFTVSFISQKYNNRQNERLMKKLRNVLLTIENERVKDMDWQSEGEVSAFINQVADFYDTDVTLFDRSGKVIASSISKIYDEGIIANVMNPFAFYHLSQLKESQYVQPEKIVLLDFEAAYAPIFRNKKEVLGYLQLPYFSQQADLLTEISSIVVGFINLYVVLFLIIGVIAYLVSRNISYPLTLIQQKLSKTVLMGKNEPISWHRDDEIGELVKQYNAMISALEESARKLAETEREGAWREIARQIAHEIKNPLTPMKLSIQHLQRAFKNNDDNLEEKLNRTTKLLVQQIDTLSELATEFSSFAKMPAPVYEHIHICSALQQIIDLYSANEDVKMTFHCTAQSDLYYDVSYLSRSVGNLIKNAIQAVPDDRQGEIAVTATESNEKIIISVKDNGSGITQEQGARIFLPYFSTKVSGMGLGLPIVKSMIESGGGTIYFHSVPGEGTTFSIELPKQ